MKKIKMFASLLVGGIFMMTNGIFPLIVHAEEQTETPEKEWNWTFDYTGTEQVFTAPYSGIYQFELYGAQGGQADSKEGGKGGKITATVRLSRNEEIAIYVGGQDGYNGGGSGTVANGGGATDIRINGKELSNRILVAGGGGGANKIYQGGAGGANTTGSDSRSDGESSTEGAGGGGGYFGGSAGIEHIVEHKHNGNTTSGGDCYNPVKHKHKGDSKNGGGCYGKANLHGEHTEDCYNHTPVIHGYLGSRYITGGDPPAAGYICDLCGTHIYGGLDSDDTGKEHCTQGGERTDLKCGCTPSTVISYSLNCGKTENTITGYELTCSKTYDEYNVKQAMGGTNYYDANNCSAVISDKGIRTGNGECSIRLLTLYNLYFDGVESLNVYYDGIKVKKVYYKGNLIYRE